ncbi:MAG: Xaa-Pro peptidase family protein [Candidatus Thorarchaeota archaeon]|nr:Xaa-Pro peptidase family protein [Candidatus Thorarchaeota archaeon]
MLDAAVYKTRIERVREALRQNGTPFALVTPSPNFEYLTGIHYEMRERLIALVLSQDNDPFIVAPSFEVSNLSRMTWIKDFVPWAEDENPYDLIAGQIRDLHAQAVALDETLPIGIFWSLRTSIDDLQTTVSLAPLFREMRLHKSDAELDLMRKAGHIIDAAVMKAFAEAHVGVTEIELRRVIHEEITRLGGVPTFAAVQFGDNSALPHAEPSFRKLKSGDIVLMDCGCSVDGYNTDMTRVGVVGEPSDEQKKIYSIVLKAQETAIDKLAPGVTCGSADGFARRVIEEENYGEFFTHRLGHGIGLEVHEPPFIVRGNSMALEPGMTHSVEPGIYLESKFGIRMEDLVAIQEDGCEVITYAPKELYIIED